VLSLTARILAIVGLYVAYKLGKAVNEEEWRKLLGFETESFEDGQREVAHLQ
jgi:hypothetical protein